MPGIYHAQKKKTDPSSRFLMPYGRLVYLSFAPKVPEFDPFNITKQTQIIINIIKKCACPRHFKHQNIMTASYLSL